MRCRQPSVPLNTVFDSVACTCYALGNDMIRAPDYKVEIEHLNVPQLVEKLAHFGA